LISYDWDIVNDQ
jgi:hypothetical protein